MRKSTPKGGGCFPPQGGRNKETEKKKNKSTGFGGEKITATGTKVEDTRIPQIQKGKKARQKGRVTKKGTRKKGMGPLRMPGGATKILDRGKKWENGYCCKTSRQQDQNERTAGSQNPSLWTAPI